MGKGMVHVRLAVPDDAAAIARIYVDTWRSIYAGSIPDHVLTRMAYAPQTAAWRREIAAMNGRWVLVAERPGGDVVGFIGLGANRYGPASHDGEVQTLYVMDDFQGQGIGRALMRAGFRHLKEKGFKRAAVWVLSANPARFFYEAMGGRRIAERNETLWGTVLPETAYGWPDLALRGRQRAEDRRSP